MNLSIQKKTGGKAERVFLFCFFFFLFFFFLVGGRGPSCLLTDPEPSTQKDADKFWLYGSLRVALGLLCCMSLGNLSHLFVFPHCL